MIQSVLMIRPPIVDPPSQSTERLLPNGAPLSSTNIISYLRTVQSSLITEWPDLLLVAQYEPTTEIIHTIPLDINPDQFINMTLPSACVFGINSTLDVRPVYFDRNLVSGYNHILIDVNSELQLTVTFYFYSTHDVAYVFFSKRPGMIYDTNVPPPGDFGDAYATIYQSATMIS